MILSGLYSSTQEMKDRERKRWLLEDFVKENDIRSAELEMAYKRFRNLAPSTGAGAPPGPSFEVDFNTWILVSGVLVGPSPPNAVLRLPREGCLGRFVRRETNRSNLLIAFDESGEYEKPPKAKRKYQNTIEGVPIRLRAFTIRDADTGHLLAVSGARTLARRLITLLQPRFLPSIKNKYAETKVTSTVTIDMSVVPVVLFCSRCLMWKPRASTGSCSSCTMSLEREAQRVSMWTRRGSTFARYNENKLHAFPLAFEVGRFFGSFFLALRSQHVQWSHSARNACECEKGGTMAQWSSFRNHVTSV